MSYQDFEDLAREPRIDTSRVQEFLDWFECFDWSEIDENDREQIERARTLKEAVTGSFATDEDFEHENIILVRENAFTEYIKNNEIELNESAWKAMPRIWQDNIDWDAVASDLRSDFEEIEWEGDTYLYDATRL